jgi:ketosteroid isomerase-like protein
MLRRLAIFATFIVMLSAMAPMGRASSPADQVDLLKVRATVWRSWFNNDADTLRKLVPPETIVISAGEEKWKHQAEVLQSAADFQREGGKLIRMEFPHTEIQRFGDVAIIYTQYVLEIEMHSKHSVSSGRATEIFVLDHGRWINPGWHTDAEK